ncbi:MAG: YdeI/OmpD-associated family protein [Acidimicrobiia bacterium]|nr:YdeI/OmpD-associated family protein [Acidimicrobiia bacterium]
MPPFKTVPGIDDQVYAADRESWRAWLEANAGTRDSIWLVSYKKATGKTTVPYEDAVEEALCFGWVDSKVQSMDHERYRQYYSRRKPTGLWNGANKKRVARLIKQGKMTEAGLRAVEVAKENGAWEFLDEVEALVVPKDLAEALGQHKGARQTYEDFGNSAKQGILLWVKQAKRPETRAKRIAQTAEAAARGVKPIG